MWRHLISFILAFLKPSWMQDKTPDASHFYRRLFTSKHRAKRAKARLLWIGVGGLMLAFPYPPLIIALSLFTTFITFSLMDESN